MIYKLFIVYFILISYLAKAQFVETNDSIFYINPDTLQINKYEYSPDETDELFKNRLLVLKKDIDLHHNTQVQGFIDYFIRRNRDYSRLMMQRKALYFPIFEEALKRHGLPDELKYLAIVESGLKPSAKSYAAAVGLWQFIPSTGKHFGLRIDEYIDERMDPYKSTEAACKFLKSLYKTFNDWELALASYNCGPGMVYSAIKKSKQRSFWKIYPYLPSETRSYVPQFTAIIYMMNHGVDHGIWPSYSDYRIDYDTINLSKSINIQKLCTSVMLCEDDFYKLNPELKTNWIPVEKNYSVRVPFEIAGCVREKINEIVDSSLVNFKLKELNSPQHPNNNKQKIFKPKNETVKLIYHTVKEGERLGVIARKYGISLSKLKKMNNLQNVKYAQIGAKLIVKYSKTGNQEKITSLKNYHHLTYSKSSSRNPKMYKVQPGDTLWIIIQKFGISMKELKKINNLKNDLIVPGQRLLVSTLG